MAVRIRLKRMGSKRRPFYRFVIVDSRGKRDGGVLDTIGHYNPIAQPEEIKVDEDKVFDWLGKGAQLSDGAHSLLKKIGIVSRWNAKKRGLEMPPLKEPVAKAPKPKAAVAAAAVAEPAPAPEKVTEEPVKAAEVPEAAAPEAAKEETAPKPEAVKDEAAPEPEAVKDEAAPEPEAVKEEPAPEPKAEPAAAQEPEEEVKEETDKTDTP
jgi:small subunit ribosomal protein S16